MKKTFNIYCDESCHLENDHKKYMLLGSISAAYNQIKQHKKRLKELKQKHHFYGEIKWTNVSQSKLPFYKELVDYFFETGLRFRAVVIDKTKITDDMETPDFDDFYYEMYYHLLSHNKNSAYTYNVYLDIKDTLSPYKVNKLKDILNTKYGVFRNVQNVRSHESSILQLTDFIVGALSYNLNNAEKKVIAKREIIERLDKHIPEDLTSTSELLDGKIDLFFISNY